MKNNFSSSLRSLKKIATRFDEEAGHLKTGLLQILGSLSLPYGKSLLHYHDILLFFCAYPHDARLLKHSEKELKRIAAHIKKSSATKRKLNENEGLPFTDTITRFSPDLLSWLLLQKDIKPIFDSMPGASLPINEVMNVTLPSLLKEETTAGLNFEDLMEVLHVKPRDYVSFLLGQMEQSGPLVRDLIMEHMDVFVRLIPKDLQYSRAYNRIPVQPVFFQQVLLKHFDHLQLINQPLPDGKETEKTDLQQLVKVVKYAMPLTQREIDTSSYLQDVSMRLYQLERGVSVAIFGVVPPRQLPLESNVGFTLFKNGIPVSYGGTWIFGPRARFGLNIFDAFRGGESGYTLCQLLRVFRQVFNISYFEVESYMFGHDNPEGIATGAFWFYYKFGFRPVDKQLRLLAEQEQHKIKTRKNYRSSEKTLIHFTQSNLALNLGDTITMDVIEITAGVLSHLKKEWPHNYLYARQQAISVFCQKVNLNSKDFNTDESQVLEEVALWAMAMKIDNARQLELMKQMIVTKPKDMYAYQQLLFEFFTN